MVDDDEHDEFDECDTDARDTDERDNDECDNDERDNDEREEKDDSDDDRFESDPERVELLREVAEDIRGESSESEQLANVLYRTSDIYDPDEDTTPKDVMLNMKFILEIKERGSLER